VYNLFDVCRFPHQLFLELLTRWAFVRLVPRRVYVKPRKKGWRGKGDA